MGDCSPPLGAGSANLRNDRWDTQHAQKIVTAPSANPGLEQLVGGGTSVCATYMGMGKHAQGGLVGRPCGSDPECDKLPDCDNNNNHGRLII
jgi:hypothetical protein